MRRVNDVEVFYQRDPRGLLTGKYKIMLQVGRKQHFSSARVTVDEFRAMERQSEHEPVLYLSQGSRNYWRFEGFWYADTDGLTVNDVHALLVKRRLMREDEIKRAKSIAANGQLPDGSRRTRVRGDVRMLVFQRDGSQCVRCGSDTDLQLDHIIPVSMGGANTEANLEVLCGTCNRRKGASIA